MPLFNIGVSIKDVDELTKYAETVHKSYTIFNERYSHAEKVKHAYEAVRLLHGYTPHTHRKISKATFNAFKKRVVREAETW